MENVLSNEIEGENPPKPLVCAQLTTLIVCPLKCELLASKPLTPDRTTESQ